MKEMGKRKEESRRPLADTAPGYARLDAWRFTDDLAVQLFHVAKTLPSDTRWLSTQIVRAATSAPANIAEGYARASNREFLQHLAIAHGSLHEVAYYVHFMGRTQLVDPPTCSNLEAQCQRASRIVYGLMKSVRADTRERGSQRRYLSDLTETYKTTNDD